MDIECFSYMIGAVFSGLSAGYYFGLSVSNWSKKAKCHKTQGVRRQTQIQVDLYRSFKGVSFLCSHKKGGTCLLDNTKCDFTP
jgi:hypothetical protein